jgi:hypothetical protein
MSRRNDEMAAGDLHPSRVNDEHPRSRRVINPASRRRANPLFVVTEAGGDFGSSATIVLWTVQALSPRIRRLISIP